MANFSGQDRSPVSITDIIPYIDLIDTTTGDEDYRIYADSGIFYIRNTSDGRNDLTISDTGAWTISGAITANSSLAVSSTLSVTGATTLSGNLTINDGVSLDFGNSVITIEQQGSNPSFPTTNHWKLFFKSDGLNVMDAGGTVTLLGAAGSGGGVTDHGALTGLGDDDHTIYALLAGRSGGQTIIGGTGSGDDITLASTSHGTKGNIYLGTSTIFSLVQTDGSLACSLVADISSGNAYSFTGAGVGELSATTGTQSFFSITPNINQSSTAGYNGLLVNVTETATGSGNRRLIDIQRGGNSYFHVSSIGAVINTQRKYVYEPFLHVVTTNTFWQGNASAGGSSAFSANLNPSRWVLTTSTTSGGTSYLYQGSIHHFINTFQPSFEIDLELAQTATTEMRVGFVGALFVGLVPSNCIQIVYDSSVSAAWRLVCRSAAVESTNTGSNATTSQVNLKFQFVSDTEVEWFIDGVRQGSVATNIPTVYMQCHIRLQTLAAAQKITYLYGTLVGQDKV